MILGNYLAVGIVCLATAYLTRQGISSLSADLQLRRSSEPAELLLAVAVWAHQVAAAVAAGGVPSGLEPTFRRVGQPLSRAVVRQL